MPLSRNSLGRRRRRTCGGSVPFGMEPLPPRVMWSAAPSSPAAEVARAGWDVVLIDRSLPDQAVLRRALEPGGHVILYDGRRDSAGDLLANVTRWAEAGGATIRSL